MVVKNSPSGPIEFYYFNKVTGMSNKKPLRICETCCSLNVGLDSDRGHGHLSSRSPLKSNTANLSQALHTILQSNRSKRKFDFSPIPRTLQPGNQQNRRSCKPRNKSPNHHNITPHHPRSVLQQTLRLLKLKSTQNKCKLPRHQHSKLSYVCLDPKCQYDRLGCAYCFVEQHQSHRKMKVEDFLKGFTEGYLQYLGNFQQVLKNISMVKKRCEESLEVEINHLKHTVGLCIDKLGKKMVTELHHKINTKLAEHHQTLEKSVQCINSLHDLESMINQPQSFELKLNHLVGLDYSNINEDLMVSLENLKKLKEEDCSNIFKDQFIKLSTSLTHLFFNGGTTQPQQPVQDSLGFIQQISITGKIRNLKYISHDTSPKSPTREPCQPLLLRCSFSNKLFINPQSTQTPSSSSSSNLPEYVNTCTIFKCCSGRYCCTNCHNLKANHQTQEYSPSERVCMRCQSCFQVPYTCSVPINCKGCTRK